MAQLKTNDFFNILLFMATGEITAVLLERQREALQNAKSGACFGTGVYLSKYSETLVFPW